MSLLQNPAEMDALAEDYGDEFEALTPDTPASAEEEAAMAIGLVKIREDLYGDESLPKFANVFHQDQRELYEVVADLAVAQLQAAKQYIEEETDEEAPASVFFSEGGLLEQAVQENFRLAQQLTIPGSDDPDQYVGALSATYQKAGEYIMEVGDEMAIREATELGGEMVAEKETGTTDLDAAKGILQKRLKKKGVPEGVHQALSDMGGFV